jgi:rhodanese-related sulfurtransferase
MGILSKKATEYLIKHGYKETKNIEGGINTYGKLFDHNIVNF